jgi:3-oxoacyl-[acyl-carrier-protein] synthase II
MGESRVVITGMGVVAPIGVGLDAYRKSVFAGVSGAARISHFDPTGLPCHVAACVREEALEPLRTRLGVGSEERRSTIFALASARMAAEAAGVVGQLGGPRAGVFFGTSGERLDLRTLGEIAYRARNGLDSIETGAYVREYCARQSGEVIIRLLPQYITARLAETYGILGPCTTIQTACTSSAQAVGEALRAIRRGEVDLAIAGGAECIVTPLELQVFGLLGVLSRRNDRPAEASRPFDARRDGFVMGEGAGVLILERLDRALARGAPVLAELAGYGTSCDAYRLTDEAPDGRGAVLAMTRALKDAGVTPRMVDYINAHGTATQMNDRVETAAIKTVFGERAYMIPVSSTKSMIGHAISAAGAIELITGVLAIQEQVLPPTINYEIPDPDCDLDYVPNRARPAPVRTVLSNSFAFGGHNDCLVVRQVTAKELS